MRVITAVIGAPLLLLCCYIGGWLLAAVCGLLAVLGVMELDQLFEGQGWPTQKLLSSLAVLALVFSLGISRHASWPFAVAVLAVALVYAIYSQRQNLPLGQGLAMTFAILYIGTGFGSLLALRWGLSNWLLILLAFLNVWATDIAAYEIGRRFGKNKLAPTISPNKTVEGALAGLACAFIVCGTYMVLSMLEVNLPRAMGLAVLFSVLAQAGDLLESALKRWAGVKDSGYLFPGHGGVLDRFDSLLLSAPFILLLVSTP